MKVETFHFSDTPTSAAARRRWMHHPPEDALAWRDNRFAVFDGVTLAHQHPYPDPSPAAEAARRGCEAVLGADTAGVPPEETLHRIARVANQSIRQLNESLGITEKTVDYLAKQYAAAVGAYGLIQDSTLHCAQITDCEVMVLGERGDITFRLDTPKGPIDAYMQQVRAQTGLQAGSPEEHQYVRKHVINNAKLGFKGQHIRVGVFTGEPRAEQFVRTGHQRLTPGDTVLFYSDGMTPFIENPDFRRYLATAEDFSDFEHYHRAFAPERHERSLIIMRPFDV